MSPVEESGEFRWAKVGAVKRRNYTGACLPTPSARGLRGSGSTQRRDAGARDLHVLARLDAADADRADAVAVDDDEAFDEKMRKLTEKLGEQMARGAELDMVTQLSDTARSA